MSNLYIGLISGTSVDGIDAVLARFEASSLELLGAQTQPWDPMLARRINALIETQAPSWSELGTLHVEIGRAFAEAARALLEQCDVAATAVAAIGHHGQTVHHAPDGPAPFTLQIGDPNTVAARTGITTVADLRGYDMAVGGQGAPLVPAFHEWLLRSESEQRVVLNIGGIANITTLCPGEPVLGCDTGPGNTLLDAWIRRHTPHRYDDRGQWAAQGAVVTPLLEKLLSEPWFDLPPPKSTGRELFNSDWLAAQLVTLERQPSPIDVQTTLVELTAITIAQCIARTAPRCRRVIVCGGGASNDYLMTRLSTHCSATVETSAAHGVAPDWVEALAFAWLARARLRNEAGNVPSVTGARRPVILGGIYSGSAD